MAIRDEHVPRLVVTEPDDQAGLVLPLSAPQMVIGHSDTADLILEDRFVSRRHALVITDASGTVTILDLNSTGGTFVNDERIDELRVLQPGDVVRFADLSARFESAVSAAASGVANAPTQLLYRPAGIGTAPVTAGPVEPAGPPVEPAGPPVGPPVQPPVGPVGPGEPP